MAVKKYGLVIACMSTLIQSTARSVANLIY